MRRRFIEGSFELDKNVSDLVKYEEEREEFLNEILEWGNDNKIGILFGTSQDNTYMCEFNVVCNTSAMCKGYVAELKNKLKKMFPKAKIIMQVEGSCL